MTPIADEPRGRRLGVSHQAAVSGHLLSSELRALQQLLDYLHEPRIRGLLKIQLPGFVAIDQLASGKWSKVSSMGQWLTAPTMLLSRLTTGAGRGAQLPFELQFLSEGNVTVFVSHSSLGEEYRVIRQLSEQGERLRLFLVKHFELENLLSSETD